MTNTTVLTIFAVYLTLLNVAVVVCWLLHVTGLLARLARWLRED